MTFTFRGLLTLATETVRDPREAFGRLLDLRLSTEVLWQAFLLVVVLSVMLAEVGNLLVRTAVDVEEASPQFLSPFVFGGLQTGVLLLTVLLVDRVGRAMGGGGDFNGALLAVTWLQFIMVLLQAGQAILLVLLPPLAGLLVVAGLVLFLYLLAAFVAELHGFTSIGRTFAMILFVLVGVALGLSFILTLLGVTVPR